MKLTIPAKTVEVCDLCKNDQSSTLKTCAVCSKRFCLWCRAIVSGCFIEPEVCELCGKREDVLRIVRRYAPDFEKLVKDRDAALRRLRKKGDKP